MKTKKKVLAIVLSVAMVMSVFSSMGSGASGMEEAFTETAVSLETETMANSASLAAESLPEETATEAVTEHAEESVTEVATETGAEALTGAGAESSTETGTEISTEPEGTDSGSNTSESETAFEGTETQDGTGKQQNVTELETQEGNPEENTETVEPESSVMTENESEESEHCAGNITNQIVQLKLNLGNAWYQNQNNERIVLEELVGAIDYREIQNNNTVGVDVLYRLNLDGAERTVHTGDWFEITLPDVFSNIRLDAVESYGSESMIDAVEVQIYGNTIKVIFKDIVENREIVGIHGTLHLAFDIMTETLGAEASEYFTDIQEGNTYAIYLPAKTEETEATVNVDFNKIEEVKQQFLAIINTYFAEQLPENVWEDDLYETILGTIQTMDEEILSQCMEQVTVAMETFDGLTEAAAAYFIANEAGLYNVVMNSLAEVLNAVMNGDVNPMSLLPLEEIQANLVLTDEIKTIDDVLRNLRDSNGNEIIIEGAPTVAWKYEKDSVDGNEQYKKYNLGMNEEINLKINEEIPYYTMELIVGKGGQLDSGNKRYIITVYQNEEVSENITISVYTEDEMGVRSEVNPDKAQEVYNSDIEALLEVIGIKADAAKFFEYAIPAHNADSVYYLGINSVAANHPDRNVEVYTFAEYINYLSGGGMPITDKILNQNMERSGSGYAGNYRMPSEIGDLFNEKNGYFVVVEKDIFENETRTTFVGFCVAELKDISYVDSNLFYATDAGKEDVICFSADSINMDELYIDMSAMTATGSGCYEYFHMLKEGYAADTELNCVFKAHGNVYGDEANCYVKKAVVGLYDSLAEADNLPDIKEQLFPVDLNENNPGYKANYDYSKGGVYFTAFFEDGNVWKFNVRVKEYDPKYDENYIKEFTDAPIIGEADPWFRVVGVTDTAGSSLETYVVENGKNINMDTAYGYGYQTILINSSQSEIIPVFEYADSDEVKVTNIFLNGEPYNGGSIQLTGVETNVDFYVEITDTNGKHTKRYPICFVKKNQGPQLYVVNPKGGEVRSVFLTQYFESKHDILIANVGDEPLTDIKVELNATNCKLDDYWFIGGENNNTLAPFDYVSSNTEYGELPNLAKIRLVPDGEGEVNGTLVITAKGQEPIEIKLSGRAVNPEITTVQLKNAVKWVPYSYLVTTDNMYDWNSLDFSVVSGNLPNGMTLDRKTGEIYGAPNEAGEYKFTIQADYSHEEFSSSKKDFTLTVLDNTDEAVFNTSDLNYNIIPDENGDNGYVGEQVSAYDFVITSLDQDELYISAGDYGQFKKLWLNGKVLESGVDYTTEEGSTRITIKSQTLKDNNRGRNTISAEYNIENKRGENLKRTSQNFRIELEKPTNPETERPNEPSTEKPTTSETEKPGEQSTEKPIIPETEKPNEPNKPMNPETEMPGEPDTEQIDETEIEKSDETEDTPSKQNVEETVSCTAYIVDTENRPISNLPLEFHSTPQAATTDSDGKAVFRNIEFGTHSLYVMSENGENITSKTFMLQEGSDIRLNGDTVTAKPGENFMLKVQYADGMLTLLSAEDAAAPETGDPTEPGEMLLLLLLSLGAMMILHRRRQCRC